MAIFRKFHVEFWSDGFVDTLTPEQKYFYIYLLTNSKTKQCGIYEITFGKMCTELGYSKEKIEELLTFLCANEKIKYTKETNEIAIKNWKKHNSSTSPKVIACIKKELISVKDRSLLSYVGFDGLLYNDDTQ